jgi:hypothetical protein
MSVPLEHLWHLRDAIMKTAWPGMLAVIRQDIEELRARRLSFDAPDWWCENLAPPAAVQEVGDVSDRQILMSLRCNQWAVETMFRDDLYQGKLVCWGRPGSSLADYKRVPPWAVIGIESWWKGGGILHLESGERLFAARVEPPRRGVSDRRKAGGRPPLPYKERVMAQTLTWLNEEGERPIAEIKAAMIDVIINIDDQGGPSNSTLKVWAKEALGEYRRRCEAGLR